MSRVRTLVSDVIRRAELDETFRAQLRSDPGKVLAEHGLGPASAVAVLSGEASRLTDLMDGCNDYTCFTSGCPDSCFVTVCGSTYCSGTYSDQAWGQQVQRWSSAR